MSKTAAARATLALFIFALRAGGQTFPQGVACGDVTETSAICWTRVSLPGSVRIDIATDDQFQQIVVSNLVQASDDADRTVHHDAVGLSPGTRYFYRFTHLGTDETSPPGTFKTAPQGPTSFRFVYTGDSNAADQPFRVLSHAAAEQAELWFWAGDTAYCDGSAGGLPPATDLAGYRAKHSQNRDDPFLQALMAAVPVWVQWDDHEVANDYDGGDLEPHITPQQRADAYRAFFDYMPIRRQGVADDPDRTYRSIRYGDLAEFFILDCRQYRSRDLSRDGGGIDPRAFFLPTLEIGTILRLSDPSRTMLGKRQLSWLKDGLQRSTATWKFVLSSLPFTSLLVMPYDRWDGYDVERYDLLRFVDEQAITGVVLLSADIHGNVYNPDVTHFLRNTLQEGFSLGFVIPEFIAGPIATESIRREIGLIGPLLFDTAVSEFIATPLFDFGFDFLMNTIIGENKLAFVEPDRFAYLVVDVTPEQLTLTHRGVVADSSIHDPPLETLHQVVLAPPGPTSCFPAPLLPTFCCLMLAPLARTRCRAGSARRRAARTLRLVADSAQI
ncbi:MAG TPA: alkaline phosphatase D family protein [Phycisphaerae bacterium]|nr:alkaline phosphatase D family protein [Phycisphaerae bacterium]